MRALAALLRAGLTMDAAIAAWPEECPAELKDEIADVGRRVALGENPAGALSSLSSSFGEPAASMSSIARLHAESGCDAAGLLDGTARSIERREALAATAAIATSGTKLSGRIVAALPVLVLPLVPATGTTLFDRRGALLLLCGVALLWTGAWWIARLLPRPPPRDEAAELAASVAAALAAGIGLSSAIEVSSVATGATLREDIELCVRRVRLGSDWTTALRLSMFDGVRSMGDALARAERIGSPASLALSELADRRWDEAEASFEKATRRAPVLMVLPLTICILPGYVVLAIGPLLRGLSFG